MYSTLGMTGGIIMLLFLKESPRFLLCNRRDDEALEVIKWMHFLNKGSNINFNILELESEASNIVERERKGLYGISNSSICKNYLIKIFRKSFLMSIVDQTWALLKPPYLTYFLTCCTLDLGISAVSGGTALFMPDILNKLAIARSKLGHDLRVCEVFDLSSNIFNSSNSTGYSAVMEVKY